MRGAWPRPQRPVSVSVNQCSRGRGPGPEATNHRREGGVIRVLGQRALNHGKQRWIWAPGGATPSFPPRQMAGWGGGAGPSPSPPSLLGHSRHTASTFRSHARAPCVRPTSIALPGSAGRHSFGSAPRAGISHQRAGVGQPDAAGWKVWSADRGLQSRRSLPLAQAPAGPGRVPAGAVSSAVGRQRACTSHPLTRPCGTGGPVGPSRRGGGGGSGGSTPPRECQPPVPVVTLVVTGVGL